MLRDYLRLQLFSTEAGLLTTGVPLILDDTPILLYANLGMLLSDGDGHRLGLQWKGAAAMKPCFRHWSVFNKDAVQRLAHESSGDYVHISESDPSKFRQWSAKDFTEMADLLATADAQAATMPKARLNEMHKGLGFAITADGLLACEQLRSVVQWQEVLRYDWVHTLLSDGVLTGEAWRVVTAAEKCKVATQEDLFRFLREAWVAPQNRRDQGRHIWRIFDDYHARSNAEADALKCSSSELLSLYGLLRYWVMQRLPAHGEVTPARDCFLLACRTVDIVLAAKRQEMGMKEASVALRSALSTWLAAHKQLWGDEHIVPKSHWAFDLADHLAADPRVIDSFVVERLHLRVRRVADNCKRLVDYESSVPHRVLELHAEKAQAASAFGLIGTTAPFPGLLGARVANRLELHGVHLAQGDIVSRGHDIAVVVAPAQEGIGFFVVLDRLRVVTFDAASRSAICGAALGRSVWMAEEVREVLAWQKLGNGQTLVIKI